MHQLTECRLGGKLVEVADFGEQAPTGWYAEPTTPPKLPLKLMLGVESGLLQLAHKTHPSIYEHYWYRSGTNESMRVSLTDVVKPLAQFISAGVWLDIGCNDGTLLGVVPEGFMRVGVDPAKNLATKHCDIFINELFSAAAYKAKCPHQADVVTSIAMFYDLDAPRNFVREVASVLAPKGVWVIQMSYLPLMLMQNAFDNVCHEHVTYWSLTALQHLLASEGLQVIDAEVNNVNGGSFRVYVSRVDHNPFQTTYDKDVATFRVQSMRALETQLGLTNPAVYQKFFHTCENLRADTQQLVKDLVASGKTVWGYGASTKGNMLLQWYGLDASQIPFIADRQVEKHGMFCAGSNIPVCSEAQMRAAHPDYLLILPWHFLTNFRQREADYINKGGKFIVPLPKLLVL